MQLPGGFGISCELAPELPEPLEIQVEESYVSVYLPKRFTYSFDTNMDEVIKSVKEVAKAQTLMAEAARIGERLKSESELGAYERLTSSLERLNEQLAQQVESAREAQAITGKEMKEEFKKQYKKNIKDIQNLEKDLTSNIAKINKARRRQQELQQKQQQAQAADARSLGSGAAGAYGQRWGKGKLDSFAQEEEKKLKSQMKKRDVSHRGKRVQDSLDKFQSDDAKSIERPKAPRKEKFFGQEVLKKKEQRGDRPAPALREPASEPQAPTDASKERWGQLPGKRVVTAGKASADAGPGAAVDTRRVPPARAAGIQPLKIDLPERGVALHFKKLGSNPKVTISSSSIIAPIRLAYAVRMLVALGLLAFCVWQGISLFGAKTPGRIILEGLVAVVLIVLVLGSTWATLILACAVALYASEKQFGWLRRYVRPL